MSTEAVTPRTEAGKRMLRMMDRLSDAPYSGISFPFAYDDILAIEAEALAARDAQIAELLDVIDGIVDDTHPEGDGCPLCRALDEMRALLTAPAGTPEKRDDISAPDHAHDFLRGVEPYCRYCGTPEKS